MSAANKATVQQFWNEVINNGNLDRIDGLVTPGFVWRGPSGREVKGPGGLKDLVGTYLQAFPDLHANIEHQIAEGDSVASRLSVRGTHKGELDGVAPTGNAMTIAQINIARLEDGKLTELWDAFDELALLRQIGAVEVASHA